MSLLSTKLHAEEYYYSPTLFSLSSDLSFPQHSKSLDTSFTLGLINSEYHNLNGLGISVLRQESFGTLKGVQLSLINAADTIAYGLQFGVYNKFYDGGFGFQEGIYNRIYTSRYALQIGVVNNANDFYGMQFGFVNLNNNTNGGLQIGFVNVIDYITGVQIGLVNTSKNVTGLQLGLINYTDHEEGASIGLLSFVRNGVFRISSSVTSQGAPTLQAESGGKIVYNLVRFTYVPELNNYEYSVGLGSDLNIHSHKYYFYPQIFFNGAGAIQNAYGFTAKFGDKISKHFEIISGLDFTFNKNSENNSWGFPHGDKFNAACSLGIQFDFEKTLYQEIFDE